jgi:predicted nucleotidyltransferase
VIDLPEKDRDLLLQILGQHVPDREVWAFGSRVTGKAQRFSDLDVAILGEKPLDLDRFCDLTDAFSESDLPIRVDVVDWAAASPTFQDLIRARHEILRRPGPESSSD